MKDECKNNDNDNDNNDDNETPKKASQPQTLLASGLVIGLHVLTGLSLTSCVTHPTAKQIVANDPQLAAAAPIAEYYNCATSTGCRLVVSQSVSSQMTATQYPIVLAHGLGGWSQLFNVITYFNGIPEALIEGGSEVYVTKTSSVHHSEFRGEQLLQQVELIKAVTGKDKVNLIGHSQGGIDIRYVAAVAPQSVASVTSVASPHQGSKMADWVLKTITQSSANSGYAQGEYNIASKAAIAFFQFVGYFMDRGSGIANKERQVQDSIAATNSLTSEYMTEHFNQRYPAAVPRKYCGQPPTNHVVNGVAYYSFSGVGTHTNKLDGSDTMLALTARAFGNNDPNDGLVSACSSRLGYVIRDDYRMNHLDTINQVSGLVAAGEVNPITVYRNQVSRLKNAGF